MLEFQVDQVIEQQYVVVARPNIENDMYTVRKIETNTLMAMKVVDGAEYTEKQLAQVRQEMQAAERIRHPNMMQGYGILSLSAKHFLLFFELVQGAPLLQFIQQLHGKAPQFAQLIDPDEVLNALGRDSRQTDLVSVYHDIIDTQLQGKIPPPQAPGSVKGVRAKVFQDCVDNPISTGIDRRREINEQAEVQRTREIVEQFRKRGEELGQTTTSYAEIVPRLIEQLLEILVALEQNSVVHRGLSMDSIVVTQELSLKVVDFSASKVGVGLASFAVRFGFMPPEGFSASDGKRVSSKTDVWSVGILIYALLTGYTPFVQTSSVQLNTMQLKQALTLPYRLVTRSPLIQDRYRFLVELALRPDPKTRPSASELIQEFRERFMPGLKAQTWLRVILLGDYGLGKSTLLQKMAKANVIGQDARRRIQFGAATVDLDFVDTCGQERLQRSSITSRMMRNLSICFLVVQSQEDLEDALYWQGLVINGGGNTACKFFVLVHDVDLPGDEIKELEGFRCLRVWSVGRDVEDLDSLLRIALEAAIQDGCYQHAVETGVIQVRKPSKDTPKGCCPK